jgi:hypothetical protein
MPKTKYFTANGMLIGEQTNGVSIDYVPDALGSIVAAINQSLTTTYTAAYTPYGTVLASTGTAPNFTWVGSLGYHAAAGRSYAEYLAGARIVSSKQGRWTSVDGVWPDEPAYVYVCASPALLVDPSGYAQKATCCCKLTNPLFTIGSAAPGQILPGFVGSAITLTGSVEIDQPPPKSLLEASCLLLWFEKSNMVGQGITGVYKNEWYLVNDHVPWMNSPDYSLFVQTPTACPAKPVNYDVTDAPQMRSGAFPAGTSRILCAQVTLHWGCPGVNHGSWVSPVVWQIITYGKNGPTVTTSANTKNTKADKYCAQNGGSWP